MALASQTQTKQGSALTKAQWGGFFAAFGGWMLDGFDSSIFGLVLVPTLTELLPRSGFTVDTATIGFFGQLMAAFYLLGWGCSFILGPIADRYGRMPTLMGSIITYSIFTALSGFCDNVWTQRLGFVKSRVGRLDQRCRGVTSGETISNKLN
jgi:MFS family permease